MPNTQRTGLSQLRVGLLMLLGLGVLILAIFAVSGDLKLPGITRTATVRTKMASVEGLTKGAEVRLSGKRIGSVKDIIFTEKIPDAQTAQNNLEIFMEIDGKIDGRPAIERIRTDSLAVLKGAGVLGDNVIDITPGTSTKGQPIYDGAEIPSLAQKSVGDVLNAAQTAVGNLNAISDDIKAMTGNIRGGQGTIGKFVNDEAFYLNLDRTVRQTEKLLVAIREGQGTAGQLISNRELYDQATTTVARLRSVTDQVGDQLASGRGTIGKLFKDEALYNEANRLVASLNETSARLERTSARIENGEGTVGKLLKEEKIYNDARDAIARLNTITNRLERGEGTAGLLLKDERLYNNVNNVSAEVTKLLYDFRQNPKKYLSVRVSLF